LRRERPTLVGISAAIGRRGHQDGWIHGVPSGLLQVLTFHEPFSTISVTSSARVVPPTE
jgi:hypothetical protein